jgi:hypothetical protein
MASRSASIPSSISSSTCPFLLLVANFEGATTAVFLTDEDFRPLVVPVVVERAVETEVDATEDLDYNKRV